MSKSASHQLMKCRDVNGQQASKQGSNKQGSKQATNLGVGECMSKQASQQSMKCRGIDGSKQASKQAGKRASHRSGSHQDCHKGLHIRQISPHINTTDALPHTTLPKLYPGGHHQRQSMLPNVPPLLCSGCSTVQRAQQQVLYSRVALVGHAYGYICSQGTFGAEGLIPEADQ